MMNSYAKAFPGVPIMLPVTEARRWRQLKQQSGCVQGSWCAAYPTKAVIRLEAMTTRESTEADGSDNDYDEESRVRPRYPVIPFSGSE